MTLLTPSTVTLYTLTVTLTCSIVKCVELHSTSTSCAILWQFSHSRDETASPTDTQTLTHNRAIDRLLYTATKVVGKNLLLCSRVNNGGNCAAYAVRRPIRNVARFAGALFDVHTTQAHASFRFEIERFNNASASTFKLDKYEKIVDVTDSFQLTKAGWYFRYASTRPITSGVNSWITYFLAARLPHVFTARRYASAVYAVVVCLSVCLFVCPTSLAQYINGAF